MRKEECRIKFEIIVVCFNAGDKLKYTLDSIYGQEYHNYHVIIKDGKSSDGALEALKDSDYFSGRIATVTDIYSTSDKGIYDGMNEAVNHIWDADRILLGTHDRYVIFMNCGDCFYDKQTLGKVADYIDENIDVKQEKPYIFYGNQFNRLTETLVSSAPSLNEFALYRNVPCHQVCFYEDRLFKDRGYDLKYRVRADYEHFLYSIYELGAITSYIDLVISAYEGGGFSETAENRKKSEDEHIEITEQYMGKRAKKYKRIMVISGAGLRTRLAESKRFSKAYNAVKSLIYGKKKR